VNAAADKLTFSSARFLFNLVLPSILGVAPKALKMLVIQSEEGSNNFITGMMETRLLGIEPFSTPDRTEKSKDLSTARGSTSSNRYLRLDFE
jgi:hypothetical protein